MLLAASIYHQMERILRNCCHLSAKPLLLGSAREKRNKGNTSIEFLHVGCREYQVCMFVFLVLHIGGIIKLLAHLFDSFKSVEYGS